MKWILATIAVLIPAAASAAPARHFMHDAIQGDNSETSLGTLAAKRGHSASVRAYGRLLATDHRAAKADAVAVARQLRLPIANGVMPEAAREYAKLQRMSAPAFDREFARYMVDDHKKDIAEFERQVKTGDRTTAALARRTLPHLRHHLQVAMSLRG